MPFDLAQTLRSLASRNPGQTEADIQASIRDILLYGNFDLDDPKVLLEEQVEADQVDDDRLAVASEPSTSSS